MVDFIQPFTNFAKHYDINWCYLHITTLYLDIINRKFKTPIGRYLLNPLPRIINGNKSIFRPNVTTY